MGEIVDRSLLSLTVKNPPIIHLEEMVDNRCLASDRGVDLGSGQPPGNEPSLI
jgi:hypothetical protein